MASKDRSENRLWNLISRKDNGDITPEELKELESLLNANEPVKTANGFIEEIWQKGITIADCPADTAAGWDAIQKRLHPDPYVPARKIKPVVFRWSMVAASLAVLLVSGIVLYSFLSSQNKLNKGPEDSNQVSTQLGSRSKIVLPDGTKVWLNVGSKLTYNDFHNAAKREVTLSGEAFFQVTHDAEHPFIVHTKTINVKDIGTAFAVKAYPGDNKFEATLIEGAIEVTDQRDTERKILLKPQEKIIIPLTDSLRALKPSGISPKESTMLYKIDKVEKDDHGLIPEIAWTQNELVFNNETFGQLAERMERWYNVKIYFEDSLIRQTPFTGIIKNETLEQALKAMQFSTPFNYQMKGSKVSILKQ